MKMNYERVSRPKRMNENKIRVKRNKKKRGKKRNKRDTIRKRRERARESERFVKKKTSQITPQPPKHPHPSTFRGIIIA